MTTAMPKYGELVHSTIDREQLRSIQRFTTHVHSHRFVHQTVSLVAVVVAIVVLDCLSSLMISLYRNVGEFQLSFKLTVFLCSRRRAGLDFLESDH